MFRPFLLAVFLWIISLWLFASSSSLAAQSPFGLLDDLYDFGDFGIAVQAPRDHVTLTSRFNEEYLVVQAAIAPGWHLYSVTQPDGGTIRATFTFESPELQLLEIRPTTEPRVNSEVPFFDVDLEEHDDSVTWILTFQETLPSGTTIRGRFSGQVCDDIDGMCIPVTVQFAAVFDPDLDVASLKEQAASVDDRFVLRVFDVPTAGIIDASPTLPSQTTFTLQGITFTPLEAVHVPNIWIALIFAFLGGIILNIMPCVLPIIGLKIYSFFEQAGKSRARAFMLNVYFSMGLLTVFLILAFLSLGLSYLFTFELFGIIMACIVFVMALSLMDVWTLNVPGALGGQTSDKLTRQEGGLGAYFKGIITTLLAIPCGAPLLSPAINWADMQIRDENTLAVFLMYSVIGLGMASPYLLLGAFPEWLRFLPKPGEWMETFKKIMGFCLLLAVVWILYFVPIEKLLPTVTLLFALWFVCWLYGHQQLTGRIKKRSYAISAVVLGLALLFSFQIPGVPNQYTLESAMQARINRLQEERLSAVISNLVREPTSLANEAGIGDSAEHWGEEHWREEHWRPYSAAAFETALASGKMVIVDFTADWCVNCHILKATVLVTEPITAVLEERGIVSFTADCTRPGEAMELLTRLGPFQVPTLAIFDPANPTRPTVLRGWYTQSQLLELLW